ncbi:MAG: methylmalonyl Co-A mutase-associated GTPase MeaB [Myxococcota bacterium]
MAASLASLALAGDLRAAARLMRDLDDEMPGAVDELRRIYPHTGRAHIVGVTGSPGAGKSTLVDALIALYRARGLRVGIVAVDPTSPITGGAILGDRIRMQRHATDEGVFIRSLATRGHHGGLSRSTADVVAVLDAMGFHRVLIETVGVGQDEVEVMAQAHTVIVVAVPGMGDEVQAIKAGILEIADILVINKADREGADRVAHDLESMLSLRGSAAARPPVLKTVAASGAGVEALVEAIEAREGVAHSGSDQQRARARAQVLDIVRERLDRAALAALDPALVDEVAARRVDPYTAAERVAARLRGASS